MGTALCGKLCKRENIFNCIICFLTSHHLFIETCCKNPDNYPEKMHLLNISHENIKTQSANIWTNNSDLHNLDKSSFDRLTDVTRIQVCSVQKH